MKDAGFSVGGVDVAIDPKLPFMGYTRPSGEGFQVVISGAAVESGMLEGLLVHEFSHVYRMKTNHPSHDGRIVADVLKRLERQAESEEYRRRILHDLVNHIQDLYADDISIPAMKEAGYASEEQLAAFFQDWVKDAPVTPDDTERDAWANASILVNNARAIAQLERHRIEDIEGRAGEANTRFLRAVPRAARGHFEPFRRILADLPMSLTEAEYRRILTGYVDRFLELVRALRLVSSNADERDVSIFRREIDEWASEPPMHGGD